MVKIIESNKQNWHLNNAFHTWEEFFLNHVMFPF